MENVSLSYLLVPIVLETEQGRTGNLSQGHLLSLWTPARKHSVNMGHLLCIHWFCIKEQCVFDFLSACSSFYIT